MNALLVLAATIASIYAYTYSRWLRQNGNIPGAVGVFFLSVISLGLTVYHILQSSQTI